MEGLCYLHSENKGADQLRGYREADLRLCFRICKSRFSHDAAHILSRLPVGHIMKEPALCMYGNIGADQLCGNCAAGLRFDFCFFFFFFFFVRSAFAKFKLCVKMYVFL